MRDGLSYCVVDDRAIFLDLTNDRYFRLNPTLEVEFEKFRNAIDHDNLDTRLLIENKILTTGGENSSGGTSTQPVDAPTRSAAELTHPAHTATILMATEVFVHVWNLRRQLKKRALKDVLDGVARYRNASTSSLRNPRGDADEQQLLLTASAFRRVRQYVPIEPSCLQDSLAMVKFLAKRGLSANVVIGVASFPFSAHSWVQVGDLVLNDTVGNAMFHTPIQVI